MRVYRFVRYTQKKNGKKRKCESETVEKIWDQNIPRRADQTKQTNGQSQKLKIDWEWGMGIWGTNGR